MTSQQDASLVRKEVGRLHESALYMSTMLYIWLRFLRVARIVGITIGVLAGGFASWSILERSDDAAMRTVSATCALVAGLVPSLMAAWRLDDSLEACSRSASLWKNAEIRLRQMSLIDAGASEDRLHAVLKQESDALAALREESLTPPEWCFRVARRKIKAGDYSFTVDGD